MPSYKLTEAAFINDRMHPAGDTIMTDLPPGPHMEPAKDEKGREDKEARAAKDKAGDDAAPVPGDPKFIGDLIDGNVTTSGDPEAKGQMAPPGVKVDATGQVRGVTKNVGTGDPADGTNAPSADGPGLPAKPSKG